MMSVAGILFLPILLLSSSVFAEDICDLIEKANKLDRSFKRVKSTISCSTVKAPSDCLEIKNDDHTAPNGVYTIFPKDQKQPFDVYCDMTTDGGGWVVVQRRKDGSENFHRPWIQYAMGFGNMSGEFWLGNIQINRLTSLKNYVLRIDMEDFVSNKAYAKYSIFTLDDMGDMFKLNISDYSGTAGDSFSLNSGYKFSAMDLDVDTDAQDSCAHKYQGAWWYGDCGDCNLNGHYSDTDPNHSVFWKSWKGPSDSLKVVEMKLRAVGP